METERLILRRWGARDREGYAAMMMDADVADWLGGGIDRAAAESRIDRREASFETHGFGSYAMARRDDGAFLGYCGLMRADETAPIPPGVEIGWGLRRDAWGQGYASEAASAVLADGLGQLGLTEILAFTGTSNLRSQSVMRRIGMVRAPERDFLHPRLAEDHPLRAHVVFLARR